MVVPNEARAVIADGHHATTVASRDGKGATIVVCVQHLRWDTNPTTMENKAAAWIGYSIHAAGRRIPYELYLL